MRKILAVAAVLLLARAAAAAPVTPAQRVRDEAEERARASIADLFRSLCPEQCVLLGVQARVEDEPVGQADPGFETLGGGRAPVLRALQASVVVDGRLPAAFRTRVKALVTERLAVQGVPATVAVDRVDFPVRNPPHLEAPERAALPPPAVTAPPPAAPEEPGKPRADRAADALADHAPLLAVVALLALALLGVGALLVLAARRREDPGYAWASDPATDAVPGAPSTAAARAEFPRDRARRLAAVLGAERAVRNAVVRDALARGESALVARWVRELGDFLVDDLRGEDLVAPLADELARPAARDPAAQAEAMLALEGRTQAARLLRPSESAAEAFAFLEGVRPDLFVAAALALDAPALAIALRFAPARLRAAALDALPPARRDAVALAWATRAEVGVDDARDAAEALSAALAQMSGGAVQADRVLEELLDGLSRAEQDALLATLSAQPGARGAAIVGESALLSAPAAVIAQAALAVPQERLLAFLAGADEDVRARVVAACPPRIRAELEEELAMGRSATRAEFAAARREIIAALRDAGARHGLSPAALRAPARPRLVEGAD